jgi:hypothetical protein
MHASSQQKEPTKAASFQASHSIKHCPRRSLLGGAQLNVAANDVSQLAKRRTENQFNFNH